MKKNYSSLVGFLVGLFIVLLYGYLLCSRWDNLTFFNMVSSLAMIISGGVFVIASFVKENQRLFKCLLCFWVVALPLFYQYLEEIALKDVENGEGLYWVIKATFVVINIFFVSKFTDKVINDK